MYDEAYFNELDRDLRRLRDDVDRAEDRMSRLVSDVQEIKGIVQERLEPRIRELEAVDAADRLSTLEDSSAQLRQQLDHLERAIRAAGGAKVAELDHADTALRTQAKQYIEYQQARAELLDDHSRAALQVQVDNVDDVQQQLDAAKAVQQSLDYEPDDTKFWQCSRRKLARQQREAVNTSVERLTDSLAGVRERAEAAQRRLLADEKRREASAGVLHTGPGVDQMLSSTLAKRLGDAHDTGALLPAWFTSSMGYPPRSHVLVDRWQATAIEVLIYRIGYGITDPTRALGSAPAANTYQSGWRSWLLDDMRLTG